MHRRYGYRRSTSGHQATISSIHSNAESATTDATQQSAKTAAAVAFIRAQERTSNGMGHKVTLSSSSGHDSRALSQQNAVDESTRNVLRRRQSVRFVNQAAEKQSATTGRSFGILAEPRPGFAAVRPHTTAIGMPSAYRPVSPLSSVGKYSAPSEAPRSASRFREHTECSVHEKDILSTQSVHYGVRKSKSMFMPPKSEDSFYISETAETTPTLCYNYGNGISSVPMPGAQSWQTSLRTHKSMNFLKLSRGQSSGGRLSNDLQVQIARDKFLHQTNQQRLRERPSFLFHGKPWRQEPANRSSSDSGDDGLGTVSSWKETVLGGKAHRAARKIRSRLRRVFGRSMKEPVDIPCQQVEAAESHVQEYTGQDTQDSSSDTDASSSHVRPDIHATLSSCKNTTIRLVPPTPKRLPIYQISQGYESPQNASYSESAYSSHGSSATLEATCSSLTLKIDEENQPDTGSVVILETVMYHPQLPRDKACPSPEAEVWVPWRDAEAEKPEMDDTDDDSFNDDYIDHTPIRTRSVAHGHVRESAQIDDDDTAIAQERITIKQPLGELQHNARFNLEPTPTLKPTTHASSATPLAENIGFHRSRPPPPPPPLPGQLPRTAMDQRLRKSATPRPLLPHEMPKCEEKVSLRNSLADIVISSRTQDTSPSPCDSPPTARSNPALEHAKPNSRSSEVENEAAKMRTHERLWKVEPQPQVWYANDTLRTMLVERGNAKGRISAGTPTTLDANQAESKLLKTNDIAVMDNGQENDESKEEDVEEDIYGTEGAGLMGPSMASRNIQLVGSLLSSRRSRITGCSDSDSEDAFI